MNKIRMDIFVPIYLKAYFFISTGQIPTIKIMGWKGRAMI